MISLRTRYSVRAHLYSTNHSLQSRLSRDSVRQCRCKHRDLRASRIVASSLKSWMKSQKASWRKISLVYQLYSMRILRSVVPRTSAPYAKVPSPLSAFLASVTKKSSANAAIILSAPNARATSVRLPVLTQSHTRFAINATLSSIM